MVGCAPLSDVGEPCSRHSDCRTNNCSLFAGVCRVRLEAACDETNCDLCISNGAGWSYCSRECESTSDCPGERCLGAEDRYFCRPGCGGGCPGTCDWSRGLIEYYRPGAGQSWEYSAPPRPLLAPCHSTSDCADELCINALYCDSSLGCSGRGYCSTECESDTDCGEDGACVMLPCPDNGPSEQCGPRCLPRCRAARSCNSLASATCRMLPGISGEAQEVCDPRNADYEGYCSTALDCVSLKCSSVGVCIPAEGARNGTSCGEGSDCASGTCRDGKCRGTSLRGDPCSSDFDCSVGRCVSGICD